MTLKSDKTKEGLEGSICKMAEALQKKPVMLMAFLTGMVCGVIGLMFLLYIVFLGIKELISALVAAIASSLGKAGKLPS